MYVTRTVAWLAWMVSAGIAVAAAQSTAGTGQSSSSSSILDGRSSRISTTPNVYEGGLGRERGNPQAAPGASVPNPVATPLTPGDREFLHAVSRADVLQMDAASLAAQRASSAQVRQLANRILVAHARMRMVLQPLARARGLALASAPDREGAAWLARLRAMRGPEFDRSYAAHAAEVERRDLERFEQAARSVRLDSELRSFAQAQLPALREDLRLARVSDEPRG